MRKKTWSELKEWVYFYPMYPLCWFCKKTTAADLCHSPINKGQVKNRSYHEYLNVKENAVPGCKKCNTKDSFEHRQLGYRLKCKELGKDHMDEWLASLPFIIKENFDVTRQD